MVSGSIKRAHIFLNMHEEELRMSRLIMTMGLVLFAFTPALAGVDSVELGKIPTTHHHTSIGSLHYAILYYTILYYTLLY